MKTKLILLVILYVHTLHAQTTYYSDWKTKLYGFCTKYGAIVTKPIYKLNWKEGWPEFKDGMMPVAVKGKWGFVDSTGELIVPTKYDDVEDFSEGLAKVKKNGKWGYIDTRGNLVIPARYRECGGFSEGLAAVSSDGETYDGYINKQGELVVRAKYEVCYRFKDGLAIVANPLDQKRYNFYYINKKGERVMGPFREAYQFSEGIAAVLALDKKGYGPFWGFISRSGAWIAEPDYEEVSAFRNGRASVLVYDYVSKDGRVVLDGRLPKLKEYWAFVDRSGKVITKSEYSECRDFDESGHALVKYEGKWGIIDLNGNTVIPTKYHELLPFFEDAQFTVARINRKYGFISKDGRELTEFKYDDVDRKPSSRKVKRVKLNNLYCMVDVNGDEVVPLKYEMCYYL